MRKTFRKIKKWKRKSVKFLKKKLFNLKEQLPHHKVYTRFKPSPVHGIGVFAIADIPKDTKLFSNDHTKMVWISADEINDVPANLKEMYDAFCIITQDRSKYGCPENFNQLTMSWYLNHSKEPNVRFDNGFHSLRDIKEGEELLADYDTYSS